MAEEAAPAKGCRSGNYRRESSNLSFSVKTLYKVIFLCSVFFADRHIKTAGS